MAFLEQLHGFNPAGLPLLQRVLLMNDGTLTDALEAAFLEPIALVKLAIDLHDTAHPFPLIDLPAGSAIMERKILLRGETTGTTYIYAESTLALDRLDPTFRDQLVNSKLPLGRLWIDHK